MKLISTHYLIFLFAVLLVTPVATAQTYGPVDNRFLSIQQNSVSSLEASGNTLWIGPGLNAYFEDLSDIYVPQNADSIFAGRGRVFSLAVNDNRIFAGTGFTSTAGGEAVNAAQGYYQSFNNGEEWTFIPFLLDERPPAECDGNSVGPPCDIEFLYGGETYNRTRITVPEQSPPFEVDFYEDVLMSVNWASGLLRSKDNGQTWERIILPPSFENELNPENSYQWFSRTTDGETVNRYDPRFDNNLLGFGLLIDSNRTVWVGTAGGVNVSYNALFAPADEITWQRISFDPDNNRGLLANWIVSIREQPGTDRIWMTNWRADPDNRDSFGLVYTDDGGETFSRFLESYRVNDVGFFNGSIFVASDQGLLVSHDDGANWLWIEQIQSPNTFIKKDTRYFAVSSTDQNLWVGTGDGLASTNDGGNTWRIIRVDVPLRGGNIYQPDAPNVDAFAYPNPFSPNLHSVVRIKFESEQAGRATVRIFDFGMNPVRTLTIDSIPTAGSYETLWDGRDETGRVLSAGTYFYSIDTPSGKANGKILLIE